MNTAHLNGLAVFGTIYYITFDNDISVLDLSDNSYPGNDLATPDIDCSIEGTDNALKLSMYIHYIAYIKHISLLTFLFTFLSFFMNKIVVIVSHSPSCLNRPS